LRCARIIEERPGVVEQEYIGPCLDHSFLKISDPLQGTEGLNTHLDPIAEGFFPSLGWKSLFELHRTLQPFSRDGNTEVIYLENRKAHSVKQFLQRRHLLPTTLRSPPINGGATN
jgi:hypothetical protein